MLGERYFPDCIIPTVKFGGIMVWGCFSGFGYLTSIERKSKCFNISRHFAMLCFQLWGTVWGGPFLLQHDCAPVHTVRTIMTWLDEFGVEEHTPDLNPIQHLWAELERRLRTRPSSATSVPGLPNAPLDEWARTPTETLQNLTESLPRRVEAVIAD